MIRLTHIITDTNIGGAGVLLLNQLKRFDRNSFDITVVLPRGSELKTRVTALGFPVVESSRGADRSFELRAIPEYSSILKSLKPDIVHCHGALSARIASLLAGVRVRVYTRHCAFTPPAYLSRFPFKQICGGANMLLSNGIIAVAEAAASDLTATGVPREKINVIINGVEPLKRFDTEARRCVREELGFGESDFVAGIFARLEECKGHIYLLRALELIAHHRGGCRGGDRIKILICGRGSLNGRLRGQAEELGIADRIVFTGFIDDITPYMNAVDLNLNCSVGTETSSLALSEGMSIGKPALVSDYGGNTFMVEDGVNGVVVPAADPQALADALLKLEALDTNGGLEKMSEAALSRYHKYFSAAGMTARLEELYRELYNKYEGKDGQKQTQKPPAQL